MCIRDSGKGLCVIFEGMLSYLKDGVMTVSYTHLDVYKRQIQELTGINRDTIRKVQREIMDEAIWKREKMLREEGYKPRILAVDEFAIRCV